MPTFARLAAVPLVALCLLLPGMKCDDSVAQQPIGAAPEPPQPPGKVKMYQEGGNLLVETTGKKGDIIINGRSLKGLFADVADLVDDVNSMTTTTTTDTTTTTTVTTTTETTTTETTTTTTATTLTNPPDVLLTDAEMDVLKGWVKADFPAFSQAESFRSIVAERCYSTASAGDGGAAAGFHAGCDGNKHTITVIEMLNGEVFGGVSDKDWNSVAHGSESGVWQPSDVAFLFCIKCYGSKMYHGSYGAMEQFKIRPDNASGKGYALWIYAKLGPVFGPGNDLHVSDMAVQNRLSYSNLADGGYNCPTTRNVGCNKYFAGDWGVNSDPVGLAGYEVYALK